MKQISERQLKIIASYVYVYLKAREAFEKVDVHAPDLEMREDLALHKLSDILTVFLDKPVHPRTEFNHIPPDCDDKEFFDAVKAVISHL